MVLSLAGTDSSAAAAAFTCRSAATGFGFWVITFLLARQRTVGRW